MTTPSVKTFDVVWAVLCEFTDYCYISYSLYKEATTIIPLVFIFSKIFQFFY
jgi:hypothetical protein